MVVGAGMTATAAARLDGRFVAITGGASGIGLATAEQILAAGGSVALIDRDENAVQREAQRLSMDGGSAAGLVADVTDRAAIDGALAAAVERFGRIDGLVTSAGIRQPSARIAELSEETWERVLKVDLGGTMWTLQAAARTMALGSGGSIVTVASLSARVPRVGQAAYCASKAGVVLLTQVLSLELADAGIRVNSVCPGTVRTPLNREALNTPGEVGIDARIHGDPAIYRPGIPLRRIAEASEVASVIVFLLSPAAAYITGQAIFIDGGESVF